MLVDVIDKPRDIVSDFVVQGHAPYADRVHSRIDEKVSILEEVVPKGISDGRYLPDAFKADFLHVRFPQSRIHVLYNPSGRDNESVRMVIVIVDQRQYRITESAEQQH